jgi:endonuclease/exonuclease/phosphatase family metal-dependent hydrolase
MDVVIWTRVATSALTLPLVLAVAGTLVAPSTGAGPATGAGRSARLALAADSACAEVVLVAVDSYGSGWSTRTGRRLRPLADSFVALTTADGSTAQVRHFGAPFASVGALVRGVSRGAYAQDKITKRKVRTWMTGVRTAVPAVTAEVTRMAGICPEQTYALAGIDQGASVAHRVLQRLETSTLLRGRIVGAALVADPDRTPNTRAHKSGAPNAGGTATGVVTKLLGNVGDVPANPTAVAVMSVCTRRDLVCDLRRVTVRDALAAHATYAEGKGALKVEATATDLARQASAWPRPIAGQVVVTRPNVPFSRQIAARVGAKFRAWTYFDKIVGLPAGVTLSSTGLLVGEVTTLGSWKVSFTLRNRALATSETAGEVTLMATPSGFAPGVNAGGQTTCQVRPDASAFCSGENSSGQLGNGSTTDQTTPVQVGLTWDWATISTSGASTCGIKIDGSLWCWGMNNRGQLGLGDAGGRLSPQRVGTSYAWTRVATSWTHTCGIQIDGSLWCWGENGRGELGRGGRDSKTVPARVGTDLNWTSVTVGGWHSCGLRTDGTAWCWGLNDFGQLGIGSTTATLVPKQVNPGLTWLSIDASWSSTCGLSTTAQVLCWGVNDQGQLGDGTRIGKLVPTAVSSPVRWRAVSTGDAHTCALDEDGQAWCWGSNRYGQLGDGSNVSSAVPVRVAGGRTWTSIDVGWMHSCGFTPDNQTQCWGNNETGQLGQGSRINRSAPPGARVKPRPVEPRKALPSDMVVTTFNVLGSSHTRPGGGAGTYAPARIRDEWSASVLQGYGSDIVAFQELESDQAKDLVRSLGSRYAFYPNANTTKVREIWQSIMWDTTKWTYVEREIVWIPLLGTTRPNPIVRLRSKATGKDIWVFNVHNSPLARPDRQRERNADVKIEIAKVLEKRGLKFPVIFLGDMNEHRPVFCKVTRRTDLEAVTGGSNQGGYCVLPKVHHLDWMFTSPEFKVRSATWDRSPYIVRITDHTTLRSTMSIPGS